MTEQEINNLIDSKIGKVKMSQLPETDKTGGLYSIGYIGNQSVKYKSNLLQGDPLTVRKTYQTEAEALADKNPIDTTTSLPLKIGQFVSIVDDGEKNGIYRIGSISGDGTMSLELQGKLGDLSDYTKTGGSTKTTKDIDDTKANHGYDSSPKTLKEVEDDTSVKMTNLLQNSSFENGVIAPVSRIDGSGSASTLSINTINPISGNYDARLEMTTPATDFNRPALRINGTQNEWVLNHVFYFGMSVKINSGTPRIYGSRNGAETIGLDLTLKDGFNSWTVECIGLDTSFALIYLDGRTLWDFNFDNLIAYDLTAIFGEGNEPTKEEMDLFISTLGTDYFEGEITIPAQKIWQKQFKNQNNLGKKANHGYLDLESAKTLKEVDDEKAEHGYASLAVAKTLKQVEDNASVKIKNGAVNGGFENGLVAPFNKYDFGESESTLAINSSTPISGNYDIRLTITTTGSQTNLAGLRGDGNIGDKIYLHFYAKILSGIPRINSINAGDGSDAIYGGDVVNGRNTRIIDLVGTGGSGTLYFNSQSVWDMQMDNFIRINLTETFGAGNEPTEEEMDLLISTLGIDYFEGEITIPAQKIMQWQLADKDSVPLVPENNSSPTSKQYVDQEIALSAEIKEPIVYQDDPASFENFNGTLGGGSKKGWIRTGVEGKINSVEFMAQRLDLTGDTITFTIGHIDSPRNFVIEEVSVLTSVSIPKSSMNAVNGRFILNFDTVTVPADRAFVLLSDQPLTISAFALEPLPTFENPSFILYQADPNLRWYYGHRYSSGIIVRYVNETLVNIIKETIEDLPVKDLFSLEGSLIAFLGDSITSPARAFPSYVASLLKTRILNFAVSGARYSDTYSDGVNQTVVDFSGAAGVNNVISNQVRRLIRHITPLGQQITWTHPITGEVVEIPVSDGVGLGNINDIPDIIVIAASTNDTTSQSNDWDVVMPQPYLDLDRQFLYSSIRWAVETLKIVFPKTQIFLATPIEGYSRPYSGAVTRAERIVTVGRYFNCQIIDALHESGISEKFEQPSASGAGRFLADGLHPNSRGWELMGNYFALQIKNKYFPIP